MDKEETELRGWIKARRDHGGIVFCDIRNAESTTQAILRAEVLGDSGLATIRSISLESGIWFHGRIIPYDEHSQREFEVTEVVAIYPATERVAQLVQIADNKTMIGGILDRYLKNRHITLRTEFSRATITARQRVHIFLINWLSSQGYTEIHAPVLTQLPLYEDKSAISLSVHDQHMFLTQCTGFYLEAAALSMDRVFNIGPSFRAEDSKSTRHLVEYWHVKLESTWATRENLMSMAESLVIACQNFASIKCTDLIPHLGGQALAAPVAAPFRRMTYREALFELRLRGHDMNFGEHIGAPEERVLADLLKGPTWITGNPRVMEPFPYRIDPTDEEVTVTADLILPNGYGELLGIAEKITDKSELLERMHEKNKDPTGSHSWIVDLREAGCVPHAGLGMGFERLLRWMFQTQHVRDFSAFPRLFGRDYWP